jgi:hypothetical protein
LDVKKAEMNSGAESEVKQGSTALNYNPEFVLKTKLV